MFILYILLGILFASAVIWAVRAATNRLRKSNNRTNNNNALNSVIQKQDKTKEEKSVKIKNKEQSQIENNQPTKIKENLNELRENVATEETSSKNSEKDLEHYLALYNAMQTDVAKNSVYNMAKRNGIELRDKNNQIKRAKESFPEMLKYVQSENGCKLVNELKSKSNFMSNSLKLSRKSVK